VKSEARLFKSITLTTIRATTAQRISLYSAYDVTMKLRSGVALHDIYRLKVFAFTVTNGLLG